MADREVTLDDTLLKHIFASNQPSSISIILQDWDKCVFRAAFPNPLENGQHSCIGRLEALNGVAPQFPLVAGAQEIAALCIPDLVPATLQVGTTANDQGREFQFCSTGTCRRDNRRGSLGPNDQRGPDICHCRHRRGVVEAAGDATF